MAAHTSPARSEGRFARQQLLPGWQQEQIETATVLVAGAGALGNETLKNLALLGVGHLLIVDMDHVEPSNLSRAVLFREGDLGKPKAAAAAQAVRGLNPGTRVTVLNGDLRYVLGLARLHRCDLVLGCLDNQGARSYLSRMCLAAAVPLLDAGMWSFGGEVRAFLESDGPCFDCTLSPDERSDLWLRYSCTGGFLPAEGAAPAPTTITTTAIVAGLLAQETARYLQGQALENGSALVYNGQAGRLYRTALRRDQGCPNHSSLAWAAVRPIAGTAEGLTARQVLLQAQKELGGAPTFELGRDILIAFHCPNGDPPEPRMVPLGLVDAAQARCPACGATRAAQTISTVTLADQWADEPLARLGIPDGDLLTLRAGDDILLYELVPPNTMERQQEHSDV